MGRYANTDLGFAIISENTAADNVIVALAAGKRVRLLEAYVAVVAPAVMSFKQAADEILTGPIPLPAAGFMYLPYAEAGHLQTDVGDPLILASNAITQQSGWVIFVRL